MFDTVFGLPVHILVIHVVVVLGPVAALIAVAYAVRPAWRGALKWWLVAAAVATGVTGMVAGGSGEDLERRVRALPGATAAQLAQVHDHAEAGGLAQGVCLAFMVVVLVAVFAVLPAQGSARWGGSAVAAVAVVGVVLVSLATVTSVTMTGHSGARASWADKIVGSLPPEGPGSH